MKIVFVQLANFPKEYVWQNIKQSKKLFPNIEHVLITDQVAVIKRAKNKNINTWKYETESSVNQLFERMATDKSFRGGFWRYTLERLIALIKYQQSAKGESVLHVESDVILSSNFPFEKLNELSKILWFPFNSQRDVASLLYLPNSAESVWLEEEIVREVIRDPLGTDMTVLNQIANRSYPRIGYFPVIESPNSYLLGANATELFAQRASHYANHFSGIFDAAPLGMWITGQDPKNNRGYVIKRRTIPDSSLDPMNLIGRLKYELDGRIFFQAEQIFNLHIHSKTKNYFVSKNWRTIATEIKNITDWSEAKSLSPQAFIELFKGYIWRRMRRLI